MAPSEKINIPQKPPMVMVDYIVDITDQTTTTGFVIRPENIFCENGLFREPGLIENMAQSAAAGVGVKPGVVPGNAPLGFIGAIKNLKINDFPGIGDEITTSATVMHVVFDATIIQAEVRLNDRLLASCELKIFLIGN